MLVVFDRFQQALSVETVLRLQSAQDLLVQEVWPLDYLVSFTFF